MITKDMLISDALEQAKNPQAIANVLFGFGMHCLHCACASGETFAQAAEVHGINVDEMVAAINAADAE